MLHKGSHGSFSANLCQQFAPKLFVCHLLHLSRFSSFVQGEMMDFINLCVFTQVPGISAHSSLHFLKTESTRVRIQMLKTSLSNLDSVNLHNPDRTLL